MAWLVPIIDRNAMLFSLTSFACFASANVGLRSQLRPRARALFDGNDQATQHARLDVFVNHTVTMAHALVASAAVAPLRLFLTFF
jgi:hypothetical protein